MAERRNLFLSTILLYLLASGYPLVNVKIQRSSKGILEDTTCLFTRNTSSTLYQPSREAVTRCRRLRHSHLGARINRYPNSTSTFQITRLAISGDISPNPGPDKCNFCSRTIARNHRVLHCTLCNGSLQESVQKTTPVDQLYMGLPRMHQPRFKWLARWPSNIRATVFSFRRRLSSVLVRCREIYA